MGSTSVGSRDASRPAGPAQEKWAADQVSTLFDPRVVVETGHVDRIEGRLFPKEAACVTRAVGSRRREFTCGRLCARRALGRLEIENFPLVAGADRAPLWPPGVVGSISHTAGLVGVVLARSGLVAGLGLDFEAATPLDPDLVETICTSGELAQIGGRPDPASTNWPKVLFSIKESVFKCVSPVVGRFFGFHEVEIRVAEHGQFQVRSRLPELPGGLGLRGRFAVSGGLVFSGCWR